MHKMHNSAYQIAVNFLHSNLICSCKHSLYRSPMCLGHLRWGNAQSYKLEVGDGVLLRRIAL